MLTVRRMALSVLAVSLCFIVGRRCHSKYEDGKASRYSLGKILGLAVMSLLFIPASVRAEGWSATRGMSVARWSHTATLLNSGKVLVVGGAPAGPELYDPSTGTWTNTGTMSLPARGFHTATLLNNGRVLVAGGTYIFPDYSETATAEVYDPLAGTWTNTGSMSRPRAFHTATLLSDGRVLVAGGEFTETAEVYDPSTGTWTNTGSMHFARSRHTATLLNDGRMLVAGGSPFANAEVYDPSTGTWTDAGSLGIAVWEQTATLLNNGRVLVAGGCWADDSNSCAAQTQTATLYDPLTGAWSATGSMGDARDLHTATRLNDGRVLVTGSEEAGIAAYYYDNPQLNTAEVYDPASGTWSPRTSMAIGRSRHTATLLKDGKVLVAGGVVTLFCYDGFNGGFLCYPSSVTAAAEIYIP